MRMLTPISYIRFIGLAMFQRITRDAFKSPKTSPSRKGGPKLNPDNRKCRSRPRLLGSGKCSQTKAEFWAKRPVLESDEENHTRWLSSSSSSSSFSQQN